MKMNGMKNWCLFCLIILLVACGQEEADMSGNTPIKINDFNKLFAATPLPITITDTSFNHFSDTVKIQRKALAQFVTDSIIGKFINVTNKQKAVIHPLIKINLENEYYLLLNIRYQNKRDIVALVFDKKNKFLDFKVITNFNDENKSSKKYEKIITINREPSFLVEENSTPNQGPTTYEKKGWAYSEGGFRLIYFDSNKKPANQAIINPIDNLPTKNIYSGNYGADAKNFITLRDNGAPNKYQFFTHFEKKEGACVGELKGVLQFKNKTATYSEKGDACIVHFSIEDNKITMKEDGNCGNHRGMTCDFNDTFDRIKKSKKTK